MQFQVKPGRNNNLTTFIRYMIPGLISMMLLAAYGFTDTFVVGRKPGAAAVGAMGICTPVLTITYAFGFLFGSLFMRICRRKSSAAGRRRGTREYV